MLVDLGAPAKATNCRIAVSERQLPAILKHDVVVKFIAQVLPQLDRLTVKSNAFFGEVVGANDRRVARRITAA